MFRKFVVSILISVGVAGWGAANAQTASPMGCDWTATVSGCAGGGITSTAGFMLAHRMERHSLVTSDGSIHVIINTGAAGPGIAPDADALQMWTLAAGATSWKFEALYSGTTDIFAYTNGANSSESNLNSTTDVATLPPGASGSPDSITLVFNDNTAAAVEEAQLTWNTTTQLWNVTAFYTILSAPSGTTYAMPSYVGANGVGPGAGEYLAVMATNADTSQIQVFYSYDPGSLYSQMMTTTGSLSVPNPVDPTYGVTNSQRIQHAPHLVYLPAIGTERTYVQRVGLLYEATDDSGYYYVHLYWEVITATNTGGTPAYWSISNSPDPATVGIMSTTQADNYNSGFSVATVVTGYTNSVPLTDAPGTQYVGLLAQTLGGNVFIETAVYTPAVGSTPASWSNYQAITPDSSGNPVPSYVKLTYSAQNFPTDAPYVYVFFDDGITGTGPYTLSLNAYAGTTPFAACSTGCTSDYQPTYTLTNPSEMYSSSYSDPRLDAPEYLTAASANIPVWLQYEPSGSSPFSLLFWSLPADGPP
jgi:hypothetical protein